MYIQYENKELVILKTGKKVYFSHWEKKHGNGSHWFDTDNNKHHISEIA